ncbi:phosphoethanolamine transferase [Shimwellia blattae]|uniref:Sulfatase family protein n=1 Tax=Shimwellia blattae (strain ATCC 29907 / DSM 4481 / JCM 1650 / NBRC 105725 / CDC 9005-74) TaxID=630626 RepID=I2BAX2_SHIBC|nr:sulfatase-like hydrolase/transferase [Shimwellia blattae]AFJ47676.1 sulfatase family protein [Shimwellia blattae DSM 4481 = NBRC 105725]GAB79743.1 putative phosphoethanolamine transferase YbiP [Shimwellia blattae DSM 4481 = NBRC 105725]VDY65177.1 Putative phosphoethanolamine transferase ybiP [Shimwellia blattae]VEC23808.1 Putative phosphoethanolamine transferase ybiP [Shimwellia blattae]
MTATVKSASATRRVAFSLWPGFYFLQSLLINTALGYGVSLLYAAASCCVLLVLWQLAPRLQKTLTGFWTLLAASYYPFGQTWGAPNFNTLLAMHATDVQESAEMLTLFPWHSYAVSLVILALGAVALWRPRTARPRWELLHSAALVFSLVCYFILPVHNYLTGWGLTLLETGYPTGRFVRDVIISNQEVMQEQARMKQLARQKDAWTLVSVKPRYHIYVVVIGESARRDALGAFGGHWDNTPFASRVKGVFFQDYIAASGSTQKSLGLTLNRVVDGKPQYQDNFVTLANRAGFQSWWFSNQGQIGTYDTAIASIARRADEVHFLKDGNFEASKDTSDEQLLKMTAQVLAVPRSQPQLIVLHLMGSHPQACDRTHQQYREFVQSKETSCYLYSITRTDNLLAQLYQQLRDSGESFSMAYFSDHGLALKQRGTAEQYLAHDDAFRQNFQVPFMVLSSDDTRHRLITARRSANDFLHFFSQWTGIKTRELVSKYRFISGEPAGKVSVTSFKLQKVDYNRLGNDLFTGADPKLPGFR